MTKKKHNFLLFVFIVFLIGIILVTGIVPQMLYLMPGPEGLQVGTWGFQPDSTEIGVWSTEEDLPVPFSWGQQPVDPYNTLILREPQPGEYAPDHRGVMLVERQQPYPETGASMREITYFVKIYENEKP